MWADGRYKFFKSDQSTESSEELIQRDLTVAAGAGHLKTGSGCRWSASRSSINSSASSASSAHQRALRGKRHSA